MMRQLLKQISVIISAVMLVIASGGFSFYHHYCNCAGEFKNSLIVESADCHVRKDSQSCCTTKLEKFKSCCEAEINQSKLQRTCTSSDNCCSSEVTFLKTDDFNYSFDQKRSFTFVVAYVKALETNYLQKKESIVEKQTFFNDLPPPNYGKDLIITLHQFKIDTPLV